MVQCADASTSFANASASCGRTSRTPKSLNKGCDVIVDFLRLFGVLLRRELRIHLTLFADRKEFAYTVVVAGHLHAHRVGVYAQ